MIPTPENTDLQQKNKLAKRWIPVFILLGLLMLTALGVWAGLLPIRNTQANSNAPILGSLIGKSTLTPTVAATATATPTAKPTATPTATSTKKPTSTNTPIPTSTPEIEIKVIGGNAILRTGSGINYTSIRAIEYGERVVLLDRSSDSTWINVRTSEGKEGWVLTKYLDLAETTIDFLPIKISVLPTPVALEGVEGHWIDIDLYDQMLYAFDGSKIVKSFQVSTGVADYPTEKGQYKIYAKFVSSLMHGDDYYLEDVPYTMYYSGDFSIHGTYWHHNFGTPMSHGCVNMDTTDAEWLYNWAPIGTLVNIHN